MTSIVRFNVVNKEPVGLEINDHSVIEHGTVYFYVPLSGKSHAAHLSIERAQG